MKFIAKTVGWTAGLAGLAIANGLATFWRLRSCPDEGPE